MYQLYVKTGSPFCTYDFLFLGSFDSPATFFTLTLSGANRSKCSEFISSAQLNVVESLKFGPTGKTAFFSNSYVVYFITNPSERRQYLLFHYFSHLFTYWFAPAIFVLRFLRNRNWFTDSSSLTILLHFRPYCPSPFFTLSHHLNYQDPSLLAVSPYFIV